MWRLDEDPAQGIPDAGVALRGTHLCHSLGVYGYLLYTRRRHSGRRGFGASGDALGGLVGVLNLGYPLWLLVAVLVVLGLLTAYVLRGRVSDRMLFPLTVLLTPVCAVLVVAVAVLRTSGIYHEEESPGDHPGTDGPYRIPDGFAQRLPERHAERDSFRPGDRLTDRLTDRLGDRVSLNGISRPLMADSQKLPSVAVSLPNLGLRVTRAGMVGG